MLVLTRKLGEMIRIGDQIKVTVLEVRSGQVKLGIDAPTEVKVHREEVYARIQAENRRAGRVSPDALRVRINLAGSRPGEVVVGLAPDQIVVPPGVSVIRITPSVVRVGLAQER